MDVERHRGKVAIVTGAASGIGKATAIRLAREGATVVGCNVSDKSRASALAEFEAMGLPIRMVKADISVQSDVDQLVREAGPTIDILANVAGVMDHYMPLGDIDDETWGRVIEVNLTGVMRISRAVLPVMIEAGGGSIVTVASRASLGAGPAGVAYATSKHGVIGLMKSIAWYYGPRNIRSNAVLPGGTFSEMNSTAPRTGWAVERATLAKATMPPKAQPDEIATAISWLSSDEASNINGASLSADGGWSSA